MRFAAIELNGVIDVDEAADLDAARALVAEQAIELTSVIAVRHKDRSIR